MHALKASEGKTGPIIRSQMWFKPAAVPLHKSELISSNPEPLVECEMYLKRFVAA